SFLTGHWQVNFMQHNMSSQTFKAQMAVGSWAQAGSPLSGMSTQSTKRVLRSIRKLSTYREERSEE
ncbi:hypothetical protein BDQ12DRAFT_613556, partial [Crucibulum laeve]